MNIFRNLTNLYAMSPVDSTYYHALNEIFRNLPGLANATIYDLSELTNVSRSTIWRMVKDMGYEDFTAFRAALSNGITRYSLYNRSDMGTATDDLSAVKDTILNRLSLLSEDVRAADPGKIEEIADLLHRAGRVSVYSSQREVQMDSLLQNLTMSGKSVSYRMLLPEMIADAAAADENSVAFVHALEFTETLDMEPLLKILQKQGCTMISLGVSPDGTLSGYTDLSIFDVLGHAARIGQFAVPVFLTLINELYRGKYL